MRELAIFLPDFSGGGAEMAYLRFLKCWPDTGDSFVIFVRRDEGPLRDEFLALGSSIQSLEAPARVGKFATLYSALRLAWFLRKFRPAWIIGVLSPLTTTAATILSGVRRVPKLALALQNPMGRHDRLPPMSGALVRWAYRRADLVLPIAAGMVDELTDLGVRSNRIRHLPNPVILPGHVSEGRADRAPGVRPTIVTVARLHPQKRLDIAIRAVAQLGVPVRYVVVGEGPARSELEELVGALGLGQTVSMPGFHIDPGRWLSGADVFLLTSDFEGFGNVIVEALSFGVPVVSSDVPYGPREIIGENAELGTLVPPRDPASTAAALRRWIDVGAAAGRGVRVARAQSYEAGLLAGRLSQALA